MANRTPTRGRWWIREGHSAVASPEAKAEIGARMRAARQAQNLSLKEMGAKLERHPSTISDIEGGRTAISLGSLLHIIEVLGVDPGSLFPNRVEGADYNRGYRHGYLEAISLLQEHLPSQDPQEDSHGR